MGRLIFSMISSLDGYIADARGRFDWAAPDAEVHQHVNDSARSVGTYLLGRRMHDVMAFWDDPPEQPLNAEGGPEEEFLEIWQDADKVVFSTTLNSVTAPRTRLERSFDAAAVRDLVRDSPTDVSIGGAGLASRALRASLVDEIQLYLCPVVVGPGGTPWAAVGVEQPLTLIASQAFAGGTVFLRYTTRT